MNLTELTYVTSSKIFNLLIETLQVFMKTLSKSALSPVKERESRVKSKHSLEITLYQRSDSLLGHTEFCSLHGMSPPFLHQEVFCNGTNQAPEIFVANQKLRELKAHHLGYDLQYSLREQPIQAKKKIS